MNERAEVCRSPKPCHGVWDHHQDAKTELTWDGRKGKNCRNSFLVAMQVDQNSGTVQVCAEPGAVLYHHRLYSSACGSIACYQRHYPAQASWHQSFR